VLEADEPRHVAAVEEPRPVAAVEVPRHVAEVEVEEPRPELEAPTGCREEVEVAVEPVAWPSRVAPVVGLLPPIGPAA
jgi:hypothetical protein